MSPKTVTDPANVQRTLKATVVSTHAIPGFEQSGMLIARLDNAATAVFMEQEGLGPGTEVQVSIVSWPSANQTAHSCLFCKRL